mgnify:CR=1 FL=1
MAMALSGAEARRTWGLLVEPRVAKLEHELWRMDEPRDLCFGFEHAIDRIGNGSVWCRCCHRRTNASQRRRG